MRTLKRAAARLFDAILSPRVVALYLAAWARLVVLARRPVIVGITGSAGKTTTKEMVAAVLMHEEAARVLGPARKSAESFNEDIGLPMTILGYDRVLSVPRRARLAELFTIPWRALALATRGAYPRLLVLEYGTCWHGHLRRLAWVAPPRVAAVTTVGPAHLDRLQTMEGVVREKSEVVRAVAPTGLVVLGAEHPYVADLARVARAPVVEVPGRGTALGANIARAVGRHLGVPEAVIEAALREVTLPRGRLTLLELAGLTVIDDSFNANPLSMRLGLDTLRETARPGQRRCAVLGSMAELGADSDRYHREIGAHARLCADLVVGVGPAARAYGPDHWFEDSLACARAIEGLVRPGDCVLVKGSRAVRLERVVTRLQALGAPAGDGAPDAQRGCAGSSSLRAQAG